MKICRRTFEIAFRLIDVRGGQRRPDIFETQTVCGKFCRIDADPYSGLLAAADSDQTDSGQLRNLLREGGIRQIFDFRKRQGRK